MSNIELVIRIPEEDYNFVKTQVTEMGITNPLKIWIANGTPLPKGHGDLKDNDILDTIFLNATNSPNKKLSYEEISNLILGATPIIKADRESE